MPASTLLEKQPKQKGNMMKKRSGQQQRMLERLAKQLDTEIDLSDQPERLDWSDAERGRFYRPVKQSIFKDSKIQSP
jgi:hypothetical protein